MVCPRNGFVGLNDSICCFELAKSADTTQPQILQVSGTVAQCGQSQLEASRSEGEREQDYWRPECDSGSFARCPSQWTIPQRLCTWPDAEIFIVLSIRLLCMDHRPSRQDYIKLTFVLVQLSPEPPTTIMVPLSMLDLAQPRPTFSSPDGFAYPDVAEVEAAREGSRIAHIDKGDAECFEDVSVAVKGSETEGPDAPSSAKEKENLASTLAENPASSLPSRSRVARFPLVNRLQEHAEVQQIPKDENSKSRRSSVTVKNLDKDTKTVAVELPKMTDDRKPSKDVTSDPVSATATTKRKRADEETNASKDVTNKGTPANGERAREESSTMVPLKQKKRKVNRKKDDAPLTAVAVANPLTTGEFKTTKRESIAPKATTSSTGTTKEKVPFDYTIVPCYWVTDGKECGQEYHSLTKFIKHVYRDHIPKNHKKGKKIECKLEGCGKKVQDLETHFCSKNGSHKWLADIAEMDEKEREKRGL
ncbi:hypothetical protein VNI00_006467 [Paramarasmius palmivorus]|uniref:C2H2-type domain-containing protein n=1 Tax=Paramarasmius palmivorus TaxID=297713 RepID=A0AAW0D8X2_9AGAR